MPLTRLRPLRIYFVSYGMASGRGVAALNQSEAARLLGIPLKVFRDYGGELKAAGQLGHPREEIMREPGVLWDWSTDTVRDRWNKVV